VSKGRGPRRARANLNVRRAQSRAPKRACACVCACVRACVCGSAACDGGSQPTAARISAARLLAPRVA
jgi:hypothetical protein